MPTTTNLGLTTPTVGGSNATWGDELNAAIDGIDAVFAAAGNGTSVGLNVGSGKTLTATSGTLLLPAAASPAQTADGSVVWDSDDNLLTVGTGSARKTLVDTDSTQTLTNKTLTTPAFSGNPTGTVTSGTYTPTLTNNSNVSSSTTRVNRWIRIGSQVFVSGQITLTTSSGSASFLIDLPVSSTFGGNTYLLSGSGSSTAGAVLSFVASSSNNQAFVNVTGLVSGEDVSYSFAYTVA